MESRFPAEVQPAFESMERQGSPWAFSPGDRARWADGLDIPTMAEMAERGEHAEVLFWVGAWLVRDRAKRITVSFARSIKAARIRFAILVSRSSATATRPTYGERLSLQMLARANPRRLIAIRCALLSPSAPPAFTRSGTSIRSSWRLRGLHHRPSSSSCSKRAGFARESNGRGESSSTTIGYLGRYNDVSRPLARCCERLFPCSRLPTSGRASAALLWCRWRSMWMEERKGSAQHRAHRTARDRCRHDRDRLSLLLTMISDGAKRRRRRRPCSTSRGHRVQAAS